MKKIENIVISKSEPNTNSLWLHDGKLLYFDGGWKQLNNTSEGTQKDYATVLYNLLGGIPYLYGSEDIFTICEGGVSSTNYELLPYKILPEESPNFNSVDIQIDDNTKKYIELFGSFILPIGILYYSSSVPYVDDTLTDVRFNYSPSENSYIGKTKQDSYILTFKIDKEFNTIDVTSVSVE